MVSRRSFLEGASAVLLTAGLGVPLARAGSGPWTRSADLPYRVQEIYPALFQGRLYVLGGISPDVPDTALPVTDRCVTYDPAQDRWQEGPRFPEPVHHVYLLPHADRLYAIGGFSPVPGGIWGMRRRVFVLAADGTAWHETTPMLAPQAETIAASLNGRIHVVSGRRPLGDRNAAWTDQADIAAHQIYDPSTDQWQPGPSAPTARNSAAGAVINGRLHVIGGRTVNGGNTPGHEVFDPTAGTDGAWETRAPMPQGQGGLGAAALNGILYAFGGEWFSPDGGGVYAECWAYDPQADLWAPVAPMPTPRHGLGAVTIGDAIYTVAGAALAGGNATTAHLEVFRPG